MRAGQFKPLFLHEENVNAFSQLAAERSFAADYFTVDYTQGVELAFEGVYAPDALPAANTGAGLVTPSREQIVARAQLKFRL